MLSKEQTELIESFSEIAAIGQDFAAKFTEWNENNLDGGDGIAITITPDMSGESVIMSYTENGFSDEKVSQILSTVGYIVSEESDDTIGGDDNLVKSVDEHLSDFLSDCIEVVHAYPYFAKGIELKSGCEHRQEEIRITLPTDSDFRKLPHTNAKKIMFMHFLKDIREVEQKHSMIDESMCFCTNKKEFWIIIKSLAKKK